MRADPYGRELVTGARWARNQNTHQLAFVVAKPTSASTPELVWRPAADLPAPEQGRKKQRQAYDTRLADQPVLRTFEHIASFFANEQNRAGSVLNSATVGLAAVRGLTSG